MVKNSQSFISIREKWAWIKDLILGILNTGMYFEKDIHAKEIKRIKKIPAKLNL